MMSDRRSILGFGAGAVSKRVMPLGDARADAPAQPARVVRSRGIRDPRRYLREAGTMAARSLALWALEPVS